MGVMRTEVRIVGADRKVGRHGAHAVHADANGAGDLAARPRRRGPHRWYAACESGRPVKIVIFGLAISSSWGNGHATLWRALGRALSERGHEVTFFERDVPYYAAHRDEPEPRGVRLLLYADLAELRRRAPRVLRGADVAIVTSFCPDGGDVSALVLESAARRRVFYDLDTPVTLAHLQEGRQVHYLPEDGLGEFHLVISYTGGAALAELEERLDARRTAALYGSVDPVSHSPAPPRDAFGGDLSFLGTYSEDRQDALEALLLEPARRRPDRRFVVAGAQFPSSFPWTENMFYLRHLPPADHPAFFASSRLTLNVTRGPMAAMGFCPSGRLFEAAACGAAIASDWWPGLDHFFAPQDEIAVVRDRDDVLALLDHPREKLARMAARARERVLSCHTAGHRAAELERLLESC
jgi:spore maturation protein CgeB